MNIPFTLNHFTNRNSRPELHLKAAVPFLEHGTTSRPPDVSGVNSISCINAYAVSKSDVFGKEAHIVSHAAGKCSCFTIADCPGQPGQLIKKKSKIHVALRRHLMRMPQEAEAGDIGDSAGV